MSVYPVATGGWVVYVSPHAPAVLCVLVLTGLLVWPILRAVRRPRGGK